MLFELLAGKLPYDAGESVTIALMHLTHPVPQLPAASAWLQPLIDRLMAKDAEARFANGEEFVAAVERLTARTPDGTALPNAPQAGEPTANRWSPAGSEPASSSAQAGRRRIVVAAVLATLAVLGGAAALKSFLARSAAETVRIEESCRTAAASVATAIGQADLTLANAKFAAMPDPCGADLVSRTRDDLKAAAEQAASARNRVRVLLDRGDLVDARTALGALERIDYSASELPQLRERLDQAENKAAIGRNPTADRIPADADEPARPGSPSSRRPHSDGTAAVPRPDATPSGQQSQKCLEISLLAGLGQETKEQRQYLREKCR